MNEAIRFRVWDKEFNEYWTDEQIKENASWLLFPNNSNIYDIEIERCTGLKDKNGKLIYEGDIIRSSKKMIESVIWRRDAWFRNFDNFLFTPLFLNIEDYKIIGNINEDPELLEN